jgi:hypothetical protein
MVCFLFVPAAYSQEKKADNSTFPKIETNLRSKSTQTTTIAQPASDISNSTKIDQLKEHLNAIEEKKKWILQDPQRIQEANESGWFDQMKKTSEEITLQLKELVELRSEHP